MSSKPEETSAAAPTEPPVAPAPQTEAPEQQAEAPATSPAEFKQETAALETLEKKTENLTLSEDKQTAPGAKDEKLEAAVESTLHPPPAVPETSTNTAAAAAETEAKTEATPASSSPVWPETGPDHPLTKLYDLVPSLTEEAAHNEVFGVTLSHSNPFHTKLILQKFLRANANDLDKAKQQLLETLKWRKEFDPVGAAEASYEKERFDGLGYLIEVKGVPESKNEKDVVTFNIYGAVKDNKKTFGDLDGFLRWRVGLMERSIHALDLAHATVPIPDYGTGPDPYQSYQVHDYLSVSFIRQDPVVKAATKKTIETLGRYYPETLSRKFFVNVPVIMGWIYNAIKLIVAKETAKKFTVLSYGEGLRDELGEDIPKEYGGKRGELKEVGQGMKLV
ncbi:CRAL/TRIO domain-containing protein [Westerdykella ornata]|uniref:Phosphatidylinositol transfer protein SFH5 n=1 Tax=Westerdykella ornata TaxID=318751 RepID=A0A6A6JYS7_WESOR|nr:CRAL/TRIO domain-containing protein [Westerdykella ornata]KAF2280189.1 CRAL/TRIO domain-containing protein [Westerdykella ornata]